MPALLAQLWSRKYQYIIRNESDDTGIGIDSSRKHGEHAISKGLRCKNKRHHLLVWQWIPTTAHPTPQLLSKVQVAPLSEKALDRLVDDSIVGLLCLNEKNVPNKRQVFNKETFKYHAESQQASTRKGHLPSSLSITHRTDPQVCQ